VTEKGDWESWLKFFFLALINQSLKTQNAIVKIMELNARLKKEIIAVNSVHAPDLLDLLFSSPVISLSKSKIN